MATGKFLGLDRDKWSAIQGMGEGFAGRGAQWRAAQAREKEAEALSARVQQQEQARLDELAREQGKGIAAFTFSQLRNRYQNGTLTPEFLQEALPQHFQGMQAMGGNPAAMAETFKLLQNPETAQQALGQYIQDMEPLFGGGKENVSYSAKTIDLADGSVLQTDSRGGTRLVGPDGQEITDPSARAQAIQYAMEMQREQQRAIYEARASGSATGKGQATRLQEVIDVGLRASQQMPILRRNMDLLKELNTGGFAGAGLKIKNALGIEGADEAELTTNMARTVLGQLRDTFGAQFTEREGARLERIEAGIGKSTEGNKRIVEQLLKLADFKANRAIGLAKDQGDYYTVQEIEANMNMRLDDNPVGQQVPSIKILNIRPK
jgi:hypothetical protein